jgi:hypothetical protein
MPNQKPDRSPVEIVLESFAKQESSVDEETLNYLSSIAHLPLQVKEALLPADNQEYKLDLPSHKWCLCESPEGDYPNVYAYNKFKDLLKALSSRIGKETSVWIFYGLPLPVAKIKKPETADEYYLLLPNKAAVKITSSGDTTVVNSDDLDSESLENLTHGWLGDDSVMTSQYFNQGITEKEESKKIDDKSDNNDQDFNNN